MKKGYEREMELLKDAAVPYARYIKEHVCPETWMMVVRFAQICELFGEQKAMAKRAEDIQLFKGYDADEVRNETGRVA